MHTDLCSPSQKKKNGCLFELIDYMVLFSFLLHECCYLNKQDYLHLGLVGKRTTYVVCVETPNCIFQMSFLSSDGESFKLFSSTL